MTIRLPVPAAPVVELLAQAGILAGVPVSRLIPDDPAVENLIVLAATELTTDEDIDMLGECLHAALEDAAMSMNTQGRPTGTGTSAVRRRRPARRCCPTSRCCSRSATPSTPASTCPTSTVTDDFLGGFRRKRRSILPASPSPRRCATMCGSAGSTTRSTAACIRSARAP